MKRIIEEIIDSITWEGGNSVIEEEDRLSAIKVLIIMEEKWRDKHDDIHHSVSDTLSLLLTNEEYDEWIGCNEKNN